MHRTRGSFGHNRAFGTIFWIDPEEELTRIFLEQVFGSGNEHQIFMRSPLSPSVNDGSRGIYCDGLHEIPMLAEYLLMVYSDYI